MKNLRVTFLEYRAGTESLFTTGLRGGAREAGWDTQVVFLHDSYDGRYPLEKIQKELIQTRPDLICFLMDAPLHEPAIWDANGLRQINKIALWFDDFFRSPKTLANPETWSRWQKSDNVKVGIWDGYWRNEWEAMTGAPAFSTALAANPDSFDSSAEPWLQEWENRAVFVGTVPSLESLQKSAEVLSGAMKVLLTQVCEVLQKAPWPIRPYQVATAVRADLSAKLKSAVIASLEDPVSLAYWNHLVWRWGKRIARLRGITAVAQAGPVGILSGHSVERYAGEVDLRTALPPGIDLVYRDTRRVPSSSWSSLFRTGRWQFQITDPQSIHGGLPFRVFECGACAVPLLSDSRPELSQAFGVQSGLELALNEHELVQSAKKLFSMNSEELEQRGRSLNQHVLTNHTWKTRWNQIAAEAGHYSQNL